MVGEAQYYNNAELMDVHFAFVLLPFEMASGSVWPEATYCKVLWPFPLVQRQEYLLKSAPFRSFIVGAVVLR